MRLAFHLVVIVTLVASAPIGNTVLINLFINYTYLNNLTETFRIWLLLIVCTPDISAGIDICQLPLKNGDERIMCISSFVRWYFNFSTGTCQQFVYGGCRGNANNFLTKSECENQCVEPSRFV